MLTVLGRESAAPAIIISDVFANVSTGVSGEKAQNLTFYVSVKSGGITLLSII